MNESPIIICHPKWRVNAIELVPNDILEKLYDGLTIVFSMFEFSSLIADFEVVGSRATGSAKIHSDLDVNIAMHDFEFQNNAFREFMSYKKREYADKIVELSSYLGIKLDCAVHSPNLKSYICCYSLKEQKLYGRKPGEYLATGYRWSNKEWKWVVKDISDNRIFSITEDPFEKDVSIWRQKYGDNFLEVSVSNANS